MAYFANSSDGFTLDAQCDNCRIDPDMPCPVLLVQLEYNYKQVKNADLKAAMNLLVDEKGICQMKKVLDKKFGEINNEEKKQRSLF